jgi:hypothetical protein
VRSCAVKGAAFVLLLFSGTGLARKDPLEGAARGLLRDSTVSCADFAATWRIKSSEREACLSVSGAAVEKVVCGDNAALSWAVSCAADKNAVLQAAGGCLVPEGRSRKDGARLVLAPCDGSAWQEWKVARSLHGELMLQNGGSSLCLDFGKADYRYGEPAVQGRCRAQWGQLWWFQRSGAPPEGG